LTRHGIFACRRRVGMISLCIGSRCTKRHCNHEAV
jgi:hypothetical protein